MERNHALKIVGKCFAACTKIDAVQKGEFADARVVMAFPVKFFMKEYKDIPALFFAELVGRSGSGDRPLRMVSSSSV